MGGGIALVLTGATTADVLAAVVAVCALSGGALPAADQELGLAPEDSVTAIR